MKWLKELMNILFPMRVHLAEEIDYLRAQVAQKQRRIDELQEALIELKKPAPKVIMPPVETKIVRQPLGIDAVRAARRVNPPEQPEAIEGPYKIEEEPNAVQSK